MLKQIIGRRVELAKEQIAQKQYEKELERLENHGYTLKEIRRHEEMMWAIHGPNLGS